MRIPEKPSAAASPSAEFRHALTREIMETERQRIIVVIVTMAVFLGLITLAFTFLPESVDRLFHGRMQWWLPYSTVLPVIAFELLALRVIKWRLDTDRGTAPVARYVSAFVETSVPSIAMIVEIPMMGASEALSFIAPMIYFLFIILSTMRLNFWLPAFTGLVAASELYAIAWYFGVVVLDYTEPAMSPWYHLARSLVLLIAGVLAGGVGLRLRAQFEKSIAAATARDRVTNLFGQHVSPQVVERLLMSGTEVAGETRQVAVMFLDIRGFTSAARNRTPIQVVERLDHAFAILVEIIDRNQGIVNKFLGDGFLALFGAPFEDPNAATRAVTAAREMLAAIERDNSGSDWPLRIGIGIHVGDVVAGNVGSPRRKEYTVIGDTVNFASRIESLNKDLGAQILISQTTRAAAAAITSDAAPVENVVVRGYDVPTTVWKLA
jgi:adenylate cyclase